MKKTRCIIAAILGIVLSITASAESVEELVKRKEELIKALWYVEEWEEVVIPIGTYEVI